MSFFCLCFQLVRLQLVLIIFRRLAEDLHSFEAGLEQKRKREMIHALNKDVQVIFDFLLQNLEVCMRTS